MQKDFWQTTLDQSNVHLDGVFVTSSGPFDMGFSHEMRKATRDISVDAVYCVQNFPHFAILQQTKYDPNVVLKKYKALWNQCMCSLLVVVTPDLVRMFSLAKSIISEKKREFEKLCLIREVAIDQANSEFSKFVYSAKSGRIWREQNGDFDYRERIDYVLLENLESACTKLKESSLSTEEAQAILIQTMFIAYLEDREIISQDYFRRVSDDSSENFVDLLKTGNSNFLQNLFKDLKGDFNGDLLVAPCSFENVDQPISVSPESMKVLAEFRRGNTELSSGQYRLFGYDFNFIPIELISSVYDQFLTDNREKKKSFGAFYTPVPLVEVTLDSTWKYLSNESKKNGVFLDPACGSGIFLVRCFQRLCEHYRMSLNKSDVPWSELQKIVNRLHGRDLNNGALRISVFSLYVAMLDEAPTKDIRELVSEGCILPELWNKTLVRMDFFEELAEGFQVDVILGNPPWSTHSGKENSALNWHAKNNYGAPNKQIAWSFVWKAIEHVKENGLISLLLPANDFLYNTDKPVKSRKSLFSRVELKRIVDFSDFRRQIFQYSIQPAALLTFSPKIEPVDDYKFEFWMPKAERNPKLDYFSDTNSIDKSDLWLSFVLQNKLAFKQYAWMREPERRLFAYLEQYSKLSEKNEPNQQSVDSENKNLENWLMGRGFAPTATGKKKITVTDRFKELIKNRFLDSSHFESFSITSDSLQEFSLDDLSDLGIEESYYGPRALVNRGIRSTNRLCIDYVEESFALKGGIIGVKNRKGLTDQTKLLAGLLSSNLATWFFFNSSGAYGTSNPIITQAQLYNFPFPSPQELHNETQSTIAAKKITKLIDKRFKSKKLIDSSVNFDEDKFYAKIDELTYRYFCLSEKHIILIEDAVKYTIPSIHPTASSTKLLWMESNYDQRSKYAEQLKKCLDEWFEEGTSVSVTTVGKNEDIAILKIRLCNSNEQIEYDENDNLDFMDNLVNMMRSSDSGIGQQDLLGLKIFNGKDLYMIKLLLRRYWLESAAIGDADDIVAELQKSSRQALLNGGNIETQQ